MKTVHFRGEELIPLVGQYQDGSRSLQLLTPDGLHFCTASVWAETEPGELGLNQILIKNWTENQGVLEALEEAGVVKRTPIICPVGYVYAHVCDLLIEQEVR